MNPVCEEKGIASPRYHFTSLLIENQLVPLRKKTKPTTIEIFLSLFPDVGKMDIFLNLSVFFVNFSEKRTPNTFSHEFSTFKREFSQIFTAQLRHDSVLSIIFT